MKFVQLMLQAFRPVKKPPAPSLYDDKFVMSETEIANTIAYTKAQLFAMDEFLNQAISLKPFLAQGKVAEFVLRLYGRVPGDLWYTQPFTGFYPGQLPSSLWHFKEPDLENIEVRGRSLRIRNAKMLLPEFTIRSRTVALEAIGQHQMFRMFDRESAPLMFSHFLRYNEPHTGFHAHLQSYRDDLTALYEKQSRLSQ